MKKFSATLFVTASLAGQAQTINQQGFSWNPSVLTVAPGTFITITIGSPHNMTQVSEATWNANGTTPLVGGFQYNAGTHNLQILNIGTYYYLCTVHPSSMKGRIIVESNTSVNDQEGKEVALVFPNPAGAELVLGANAAGQIAVLLDAEGREAYRLPVEGNARLDVSAVTAGSYTLRVLNGQGDVLTTQRVVIMR